MSSLVYQKPKRNGSLSLKCQLRKHDVTRESPTKSPSHQPFALIENRQPYF